MKVSVLASGSKGNSSIVMLKNTNILIDVGVSTKYIEKKLEEMEIKPSSIKYILLTHVHNDHIFGLKTFIKKYNPTLLLSDSMYLFLNKIMEISNYEIVENNFVLDTAKINIIKLSHDSEEVNGFIINEENIEMVYITDTGYINVRNHSLLKNKDLYVIESNHDIEMLMKGKYPNHLKRRILSDEGHLSNESSAKYLKKFIGEKTKVIVLIHMSDHNNNEQKIIETFDNILKDALSKVKLIISKQDEKTELITFD